MRTSQNTFVKLKQMLSDNALLKSAKLLSTPGSGVQTLFIEIMPINDNS